MNFDYDMTSNTFKPSIIKRSVEVLKLHITRPAFDAEYECLESVYSML